MRSRSTGFDVWRSLELLYVTAVQQASGHPVSTGEPAPQGWQGAMGTSLPVSDGVHAGDEAVAGVF